MKNILLYLGIGGVIYYFLIKRKGEQSERLVAEIQTPEAQRLIADWSTK